MYKQAGKIRTTSFKIQCWIASNASLILHLGPDHFYYQLKSKLMKKNSLLYKYHQSKEIINSLDYKLAFRATI